MALRVSLRVMGKLVTRSYGDRSRPETAPKFARRLARSAPDVTAGHSVQPAGELCIRDLYVTDDKADTHSKPSWKALAAGPQS
jgi:hypothetical protein